MNNLDDIRGINYRDLENIVDDHIERMKEDGGDSFRSLQKIYCDILDTIKDPINRDELDPNYEKLLNKIHNKIHDIIN